MASAFPARASVLAVDLTSSGAPAAWQRDRDPETEPFVMARLAGLATLLDRAGTDLITLGGDFRLGGRRRGDEFLDGALALSRLGEHTRSVRFAASIPPGAAPATAAASAVGSVHTSTGHRGGWQVEVGPHESAREVGAVISRLKQLPEPPTVVVKVRSEVDIEIAAACADVARLQVNTVEEARNLRSSIHSAAADWDRGGGEVNVLVDLHAVLSDDPHVARDRAAFIAELREEGGGASPSPAPPLRHSGTASALANLWQNWVRAGAADGFTIIPGSIPTDIIAVAGQLLPELDRRGLRAPVGPVSEGSSRNVRDPRGVVAA